MNALNADMVTELVGTHGTQFTLDQTVQPWTLTMHANIGPILISDSIILVDPYGTDERPNSVTICYNDTDENGDHAVTKITLDRE